MCKIAADHKLRNLGDPRHIWAVSAIHAEAENLPLLHDAILERFEPGDRLVYLGNYTGYGTRARETLDEILTFRRLLLALSGVIDSDIVYLRGSQEELLEKLFQLPFARQPLDVLLWMLGNGLSNTLYSYGLCPHDGIEACRAGVTGLTKWTARVRQALRTQPGHEIFHTRLALAAHSDEKSLSPILFVHAGLDQTRALADQGDNFWWGAGLFESIEAPYAPFHKVVRGYDPAHKGLHLNCVRATIDGGSGFGGTPVCAGFDQNGKIIEILEV